MQIKRNKIGSRLSAAGHASKGLVTLQAIGVPNRWRAPKSWTRPLIEVLALDLEDVLEHDVGVGRSPEQLGEVYHGHALELHLVHQRRILGPLRDRLIRLLVVVRLVSRLQLLDAVVLVDLHLLRLPERSATLAATRDWK